MTPRFLGVLPSQSPSCIKGVVEGCGREGAGRLHQVAGGAGRQATAAAARLTVVLAALRDGGGGEVDDAATGQGFRRGRHSVIHATIGRHQGDRLHRCRRILRARVTAGRRR